MRVVATSSLPIDLASQVTAVFKSAVVSVPSAGHVDIATLDLSAADALVCLLLDTIDETLLERAPKLRVIANCAVGVDNIDLGAATAAGIAVTNTPDVLTEATAELAFTLMLAAARRLGEGERLVRSGAWSGWALDQLLGAELHGKTAGIVGFGRIGQAFARRALGFGMHVIYADHHDVSGRSEGLRPPYRVDQSLWRQGSPPSGARRVSVDELFAEADAISLHCPLTADTAKLVNAQRLSLMKPTAVLVNTARGGCVDEDALIEALTAGRIAGAGLDVYQNEPRIDVRLLGCPRLVLAPHIGSATTEARTAMAQLCADGVIAVLSGRRPKNLVNTEVRL